MALILYANGIIEEFKPKNLVFTEKEIIDIFAEFPEIKTVRLLKILNAWCVYGYASKLTDASDFNRIASDILRNGIYSHILFLHDSELNPDWNTTDTILYKNYTEFIYEIKTLIEEAASNIVSEFQSSESYEKKAMFMPQLISIGSTDDKRVLFGFNPEEQTKEFYENDEFYKFSQKVYEYLLHNKQEKSPFTIYADKNAIIIVEDKHVKTLLHSILNKFISREEYEMCPNILKMIKQWPPKPKKIRKKSSAENNS